jgi:uncharacterized membrane protein YhaH (DUF805 family)
MMKIGRCRDRRGQSVSDAWYYAKGRERVGPVDAHALKAALAESGDARNVLVWRPGFADWTRAGEVAELGIAGALPPAPFGQGGVSASASSPGASVQPSILQLWFGFSGRINRAKCWLVGLVNIAIIIVAAVFAYLAGSPIAWVPFAIVYLALAISGIAITIKRLHDRDKSGWWALLFLVAPSILSGVGAAFGQAGSALAGLVSAGISIWALVELGCLRGTVGPNRFGPDPLGGAG